MTENKINTKLVESELQNIKTDIERIRQDKSEIIEDITFEIKNWIKKYIKWFLGGISLLTVIALVQIYFGVINKTEEYITKSITQKFQEPDIQNTLEDVAKIQAGEIIQENLNPEIKRATELITKKAEQFNNEVNELKRGYDSQLDSLNAEVGYIKARRDILSLGDDAIATGNAESLDRLNEITAKTDDEVGELKTVALAEVFRIKIHYVAGTRIKGIEPKWNDPKTGENVPLQDVPSKMILKGLLEHKNWSYRATFADYLKNRKEKGVPDALLKSVESDPHLSVRKNALNSFEQVTGFKSSDVFASEPARIWWEENKMNVDKDLNELSTPDTYYSGKE